MLQLLLAVAVLGTLALGAVAIAAAKRAFLVYMEAVEGSRTVPLPSEYDERLRLVETRMDELHEAVSRGILHVDRSEKRVQATIRRARAEFEEGGFTSEQLNAEAAEFSVIDGEGGGDPQLPLMPAEVAPAESSIPGVTPEQIRMVRGI